MSLPQQQAAVAGLITDPRYRRRFFDSPPETHAEFGLTRDEFVALRRLDATRLAMLNALFTGKRFDPLVAAFPRTLEILSTIEPGFRARYAEEVPLDADASKEVENFRVWTTRVAAPDGVRPLLDAVSGFEALARGRPPTRKSVSVQLASGSTPRATGAAVVASWPLDLPDLLARRERDGAWGPSRPAACLTLVWNEEGRARCSALDGADDALFAACDGTRTVVQLEEAFGAAARERVAAWLAAGLVAA